MRVRRTARAWRRAALVAVYLLLALANHAPAGRVSLALLVGSIGDLGFRTIRPRLSISDEYREFRAIRLSPAVAAAAAELVGRESANRAGLAHLLLGNWDEAIRRLSRRGANNAIDLASAYYMRGVASGSLNDAVRALQLLAGAGDSPAAVFNRALVLEAIFDRDAAAAEWRKYLGLEGSSGWADEAREHLQRDTQPPAWRAWQAEKPQLIAAAMAGNIRRVESIADAHRYAARRLIEFELLPAWAAATLAGDAATSRRNLAAARSIAAILCARTGESLTSDVIGEIERADADGTAHLANAFVAYREGRRAIEAIDYVQARTELDRAAAAVPSDSAAAALFTPAVVTARYYLYDFNGANQLIDRAETVFAARSKRYIALFGHLAWLRGLVLVNRGDSGGALAQYARALAAFERLGEADTQAGQHTNMADSYKLLGDWERAAFHRQKALAIAERIDEETRRLHPILSDAAGAALAEGFPAAALSFQNRLVRISKESGLPLRIADALIVRSTILMQLKRREEALRDLAEAAAVVPRVADAQTQRRLSSDLASADAFANRGVDDQRVVEDLTRAIDFSRALDFRVHIAQLYLERGRARMRLGDAQGAEDDFRTGVAKLEQRRRTVKEAELRISYFDRAELLFSELAIAQLRQGRAEEAFDLLERGRARELLDTTSGLPAEPLPARTIQRRLRPDAWLVSFTATSSGIVTSILTSDALRVLETSFDLQTLQDLDRRRLSESLIAPLTLQKNVRLIIVADPLLHRVPFAALIDRGEYLVQNHVIEFAPSATLAVSRPACVPSGSQRESAILLAASNEAPAAYPSLPPLHDSVREMERIARLYPHRRLLTKSDALLEIARACDVIAFGGHAVIDQRRPQDSSLLIGHNGRIRAAEIEAARLPRTRLVVLGGCSTSIGEAHRSEGMLSLARSFLAAGVPSVVGTIVPVDDGEASRLLVEFHAAYAEGLDPAAALQRAQLRLLHGNDRDLADPAVWSAFQVVTVACGRLTQREENTAWVSR